MNGIQRDTAALDQQLYGALLTHGNKAPLQRLHTDQDDHDDDRRADRCGLHAAAHGQADTCNRPEAGRRRQAAHRFATQQYRPCAKKANGGDP